MRDHGNLFQLRHLIALLQFLIIIGKQRHRLGDVSAKLQRQAKTLKRRLQLHRQPGILREIPLAVRRLPADISQMQGNLPAVPRQKILRRPRLRVILTSQGIFSLRQTIQHIFRLAEVRLILRRRRHIRNKAGFQKYFP